jgi:putative ABC transport system permease protein
MTRELLNAAKTGLAEVRVHKMRSVLSFLAIAVGSVVFMDSFASIVAIQHRLREQERVSGIARLKIIQNNSLRFSTPDEYKPPPVFTYADVRDLRDRLPWLYMVSPEKRTGHNVFEYEGRRVVTTLAGVTPEWAKRNFVYTLKGRFLDWNDTENKLRVCVLVRRAVPPPPSRLARTKRKKPGYTNAFEVMVSHNDMLGKVVKIDNVTFTVVGVLDELPPSKRPRLSLGGYQNYNVLAPVTTLTHFRFIREATSSLDVTIDAGRERDFDKAMKLIKNFLKTRFGDTDYFLIENQMGMLQEQMQKSIKAALMTISLGMLAFLAGGIGIMNVTLATVFARTKEIGIRRAVGANRGDIMLQFIVEAVMLGLIGGVLGSVLGYLWGVPVKVMLGMGASPIKPWMPVVSVFIAAFTAFVFAIYPAWLAAGMKPADALRTE